MSEKAWTCLRHKETGEYLTGSTWAATYTKAKEGWMPAEVPVLEEDLVFHGFEKTTHGGTFLFQGSTQGWWTSMSGISRFIPLMTRGVYRGRFTLMKQGSFIYAFPTT